MKRNIEIVAEIAQGFEGNIKLTELLTTAAIASGADAVKYQLVFADELATPDYQYYDLFKSLEMSTSEWEKTSDRIHSNGQKLYFDVFGKESLSVAKEVFADGVKISTTEFYNKALIIEALGSFGKVFISIGGIPIEDVDLLLGSLVKDYNNIIRLMYGFQSEPTPLGQNNLSKFKTLQMRYPRYEFGFMDHSDGGTEDAYYLPVVAMGTGITVIEKHLTLDRSLKIEDYVSALSPENFIKFVGLVRKYEHAMGNDNLELSDLENQYRLKAVKVVVALKDLKKGHVLEEGDIALKRSGKVGDQNSMKYLEEVLERRLKTGIKKNSLICQEHI